MLRGMAETSRRIDEALARQQAAGVGEPSARRLLRASGFALAWLERAGDAEIRRLATALDAPPTPEDLSAAVADCDNLAGEDEAAETLFIRSITLVRDAEVVNPALVAESQWALESFRQGREKDPP